MTFMSMDVMTQCYGPRASTLMSVFAIIMNLVMAGIFWIAGALPGVWGESFIDGSENVINGALNNTFSGTWFIILGSSIAFISSAAINNFINHDIGRRLTRRHGFGSFAIRAYVSTFVAQFADNLIFALLVSKTFFGWTLLQCFTCALTGAFLELMFEVFFSPLCYGLARGLLYNGLIAREA